ncbi:ABC transporter substrate-binding protein [Candidatus Poriferisodalis sp.]|jgi:peptide/nickel transport system substrate-binding protein|uniref:ABC transporter substrate-binding protein n=1 Tax=Candidatus Poriferisodalis sp. TaxID=3101277 RepID=UPI003B5BEFEA
MLDDEHDPKGGKVRRIRRIAVVGALAMLAAACSGGDSGVVDTTPPATSEQTTSEQTTATSEQQPAPVEEPARGGRLTAGTTTEPTSLDPVLETALTSYLVLLPMYDRLVRFAPDLAYEPQVAESWSWSDDGLEVTFVLRQDVTFHSGRALRSADVVYSYERWTSEEAISQGLFANVSSVEALDDYTVMFTLIDAAPNALLAILAANGGLLMDRDVVESNGDLRRTSGGSGPFMFGEWRSGSEIVLVANPNYWDEGKPHLDELVFKIVPDEVSAVAALRAGEIDWFQFSDPLVATQIDGASGLTYTESPSLAYQYLAYNFNLPPFDDPNVRQAISFALDREAVVDLAADGRADVTGPIVPAQTELVLPFSEFTSYSHNPQRAQELLTEAGVTDLSVTLTANSGNAAHVGIAPVVAEQLAAVGISVSIEMVESGVWIDRLTTFDYDLILGSSGGAPNPDIPFGNSFMCNGPWNYSGVCDESFDELVRQVWAASDEDRISGYHELQRKLVNDLMPYSFLFVGRSLWGWADEVKGYEPLPLIERRFETIFIEN